MRSPKAKPATPRIAHYASARTNQLALAAMRAQILGCVRCEALVRCRSRVVPGAGATPAAIAFVGLAPGRLGADRTGIPFTGDRSGLLLRRMISHARLGRVFITNLVRCNPRDALGRNRDPAPDEIANCRPYLEAELALARPRIVACLGQMAWRAMAGSGVPFDPRARLTIERGGTILCAMYHPAYVNRGAYPLKTYARDFIRLRRLAAPRRRRLRLRCRY